MTRQAGIYGIIALVGLAVGMGVGVMITKQKVSKANMTIEQLQTQQSQTEAKLRTASDKISQYESELIKSRNSTVQMNAELARAKTELVRMKGVLEQGVAPATPADSSTAQTPSSSSSTTSTTTPAGTATPLPVGVREYTIKDGDNFWDIAVTELGKGTRYKEILKLNPQLTEKSTLKVGSKIKIPAK